MNTRLEVKNLCLAYGKRVILEHINFSLEAGKALALCGENGSGKTTLLSTAAGILAPQSGSVVKNGKLGYVPQSAALLEDLTFADNLRYFASIAGVRVPKSLPLGADELRRVRVRSMSGGMKKLCSIVCTLIAAPDILLMDEPFAALDGAHAAALTDWLKDFLKNGGSLLLAAHGEEEYLPLAEQRLCIRDGTAVLEACGAPQKTPV